MTSRSTLPRVAALVGPYSSGKTTLLEALLLACGTIPRKGSIRDGNTVGDSTPEARQRVMSVEVNVANATYLGDRWTFLDCPGSIEFQQDGFNALRVADAAIVVVEAEPSRAVMAAPILKFLDRAAMPHIIYINKVEHADAPLKETLEALQAFSERPLLLRQLPLREGETVTGFIDLISERAYAYREGKPSELIQLPASSVPEEQTARQSMLESLADYDDFILEALLSDAVPPSKEIFEQFGKDVSSDLVVPVLFGSAAQDHGIVRLLKSLRHDTPGPAETARRLGLKDGSGAFARVFKTVHAPHTGKLSYARIWRGEFSEGALVNGQRPANLLSPLGAQFSKIGKAGPGDVAVFARLEDVTTGGALGATEDAAPWPAPQPPLFSLAVHAEKKQDEVKLSAALTKLGEEDPSLTVTHTADTNQMVLWGQGEIHLQVALEKLKSRFNLAVAGSRPQVPYKETIRKATTQHGRHKRQSGGHGQFGDIHIDIEPMDRGKGFAFVDRIVGGVIPRQYIPAVEEGVIDYLRQGPLGFPVQDVRVTLTNGSYHAVDSSDMAFKTAARIGMSEGMPKCEPVLLEPVLAVEIDVPNDYTSKAQRIISGRRGQILGYEAKEGWPGWDSVQAYLPQAEMTDMIVELRSLTMGVGTFSWRFDHLQEITGRLADKAVEERRAQTATA